MHNSKTNKKLGILYISSFFGACVIKKKEYNKFNRTGQKGRFIMSNRERIVKRLDIIPDCELPIT